MCRSTHGDVIREFNTAHFKVIVDALPEDDLDLSFDDSGEVARKLDSGEFIAFIARARVIHKDTGAELASDYLGGCIYKSLNDFEDHRECGAANRRRIKREGRFQIYRKARKYEQILSPNDKLRKRGFSTRAKAEAWAQANATEPFEVLEGGKCGSYFSDMIHNVIQEARAEATKLRSLPLRAQK